MNMKTKLVIIVSSLVMNACSAKIHADNNSKAQETQKPVKINMFYSTDGMHSYVSTSDSQQKTMINDTVRVIGVLTQPEHMQKKYLYTTNKSGKEYVIKYEISPINKPDDIIAYTERGDIIVIQNNKIVKNLTIEKLKQDFLKSRTK